MNYLEARDNIKSGDLLAFNHGNFTSWSGIKTEVVHMATRSTYSHVAVAFWLGKRLLVLEAVEPCIRIFPLSLSGPFYWTPMKAPWKPETEEYALSKVGTPYSQLDAIRAYFTTLPEGQVSECAAYVREIMIRDGIDLGHRSTPDAVVLQAQLLGNPTYYVNATEN